MRYEEVSDTILELANNIKTQYFPNLEKVKIKFLYDCEKRESKGKLVLGRCMRTNDVIQYFTVQETQDLEGYPYIIFLDRIAVEILEEKDIIRIIRHELQHVKFNSESKTKYKIRDHDITDFVLEVERNMDDPRWLARCVNSVLDIYEQMEADE